MYDLTGLSLGIAQTFAKQFIKDTSQWAKAIGKPIFLEVSIGRGGP